MVVDLASVTDVRTTDPDGRGGHRAVPAPSQAGSTHPQGWYPDPRSSSSLRWWDGRAWTAHLTAYPQQAGPEANAEATSGAGLAGQPGDKGVAPGETAGTEAIGAEAIGTEARLTGDVVREVPLATARRGYDRLEVDPFRLLLAAELDAGRSPAPLVSRASFSCSVPGLDRGEVERLLARAEGPAGGADSEPSGPPPASVRMFPHQARRSGRGRGSGPISRGVRDRNEATEECDARWRLLDRGEGLAMELKRTRAGWMLVAPSGAVLAIVDDPLWFDDRRALWQHRPNAWMHRLPTSVHVDQRDYSVRAIDEGGRDGVASDLRLGHLAVVDPTGRAVLQLVGHHFNRRAGSVIRRPSGELIQFPVYETSLRNAVMHATEQSGRVILRFRETRQGRQAIADPSVPVTSDIVLLVVLASTFLPGYFRTPWGTAGPLTGREA